MFKKIYKSNKNLFCMRRITVVSGIVKKVEVVDRDLSFVTVLPIADGFYRNLEGFFLFMLIFLFVGAFYSMAVSIFLCIKNYSRFKKEFSRQFKINKKKIFLSILISILFILLSYVNYFFIFIAISFFILPYLYLYAKAVDEIAMIKSLDPRKLREGDWLYQNIKVKNMIIKANWDGLTKVEISLLKKGKKMVKIREGIAFTPVFLISFLVFSYFWFSGLRIFLF